jgi:hypothetical protein
MILEVIGQRARQNDSYYYIQPPYSHPPSNPPNLTRLDAKMSGPSETSKPAEKPITQTKETNPATKLEEDDEFEDFPSEGIVGS